MAAARRVAGGAWPLLGVLIAIVIGSLDDPVWTHLATLVAIWTLWGMSLNLIWGYAGQFSMAQTALGALAAYVAGVLVGKLGYPVYVALGLAFAAAIAASVAVGLVALRLRGFYFAIMTLAFLLVLQAVLDNTALAGRTSGLAITYRLGEISLGPVDWNLSSRHGGFLVLTAAVVTASILATRRFLGVRLGRATLSVRDDEFLAMSFGINPSAYKILAFGLSAVFAAAAGLLLSLYLHYITPDFYGFDTLITMIVILVIGGVGRVLGPVVGAVIYVLLVDGLRVGGEYRQAVFGAILILIVMFAPQGLVGLALTAWRRGDRRRLDLRAAIRGAARP